MMRAAFLGMAGHPSADGMQGMNSYLALLVCAAFGLPIQLS